MVMSRVVQLGVGLRVTQASPQGHANQVVGKPRGPRKREPGGRNHKAPPQRAPRVGRPDLPRQAAPAAVFSARAETGAHGQRRTAWACDIVAQESPHTLRSSPAEKQSRNADNGRRGVTFR